jgi:hypothetical protein
LLRIGALSLVLPAVAWAQHRKPPPPTTAEREPAWEPTEGGRVMRVPERGTPFGDYTRLPVQTIRNGQPTNRIGAGTLRPGED